MITNKENHHDIAYIDESEISAKIIDNHFYDMAELPDGYYEVETTKKKINLDLPIHISFFILNYAKLRMLEFYNDFLDYYLHREVFELLEVDMDSNYLGITVENVDDLIKPKHREGFENEKHNWFVTPLAAQGRHTPGLFKVEFKGDKNDWALQQVILPWTFPYRRRSWRTIKGNRGEKPGIGQFLRGSLLWLTNDIDTKHEKMTSVCFGLLWSEKCKQNHAQFWTELGKKLKTEKCKPFRDRKIWKW